MEAMCIDFARGHGTNGHLRRAGEHGAEELLAFCGTKLLRVIQERERPHAVVAEALVVEQHTRDDERPGQRAPARLVRAGDEARA